MTMRFLIMAMAMFHFGEGGRIRSDVSTGKHIKATMVGEHFQGQVKHAVEQVDTMLADSKVHNLLVAFEEELIANPQLQQQLEAMMKDPSLQEQMASVQKQMEA